MSATARFAIPLLAAGQAQKEIFHNEAIQTLETLVCPAVEEGPRVAPPSSPAIGACYIVAATPTGAWAANPLNLAAFTAGGWRFVAPVEGMVAFVRSLSVWATFRASVWELGVLRGSNLTVGGQQVVGGRAAAIPSPSGGTTLDTQARSAIGQILIALRQHGLIET